MLIFYFLFFCTVVLKLYNGYPKRNSTQFTDVIDGIKVKKQPRLFCPQLEVVLGVNLADADTLTAW